MEKVSIARSNVHIKRIYFGDSETDYISISVDDPTLFDQFASGYKKIIELAEETSERVEEIKEPSESEHNIDYFCSISKENVKFSIEAIAVIDGIFGKGTLEKYFADVYDELPDFVPNIDCILEFFEKMIPVMEESFSKSLEEREQLRKAKMAKYTPQDHKRAK